MEEDCGFEVFDVSEAASSSLNGHFFCCSSLRRPRWWLYVNKRSGYCPSVHGSFCKPVRLVPFCTSPPIFSMKQKTVLPKERFYIAKALLGFPWWTKLWQFSMSSPSSRWILPASAQEWSPPCRAKGIWFCSGYCCPRPSKPGVLACELCPQLRSSFSWCETCQKLFCLYQVAGI